MAHKTTLLIYGIPVTRIIVSMFFVFCVSHFFGNTFYLLLIAVSILVYASTFTRNSECVFKVGGFLLKPLKAVVTGLPDNFISDINQIIESGEIVIVGLPRDLILRRSLNEYVKARKGKIQIVDSGEIVVASI